MSAFPSHSLTLTAMLAPDVGFDDGDGGGFDGGFYDRCMASKVIFYRAREGNVRAPPRYFAGYPDSPFVR